MHRSLFLLLAAAAALAQTPPAFRLPDDVVPTRYIVDLKLSPPDDNFSGTVEIRVDLKKTAGTIWLHADGLTAHDVRVEAGGTSVPARAVTGGKDFLGIVPDRPVGPGAASIRIAYSGKLSKNSSDGLFLNQENRDWYVFSQFEPISARRAFPCFDEPGFKTPWQLTLRVPKGNRAFSNTPQTGETTGPDGTVVVKFAETRPLPSYLVALAVGPIDAVEARPAGANRVPVRILVPRGRSADAAYAAKVTPEILERLEGYFGIPYPYEKLDNVAVPLLPGAMENAGLVTYEQNLILARPADESVRFRRDYVSVAMHELAHQWFGDLVTMAWWDDLWLNEAFATWMEQTLVAEWRPEWRMDVSEVESKQYAMSDDSLVSARRVRQPIVSADDIANAFDSITYQKGAAVIRMFENWTGSQPFRRGVQLYLKRHQWGNATGADFLHDVSEGAGKDIAAAFSTFLDQPGVPMVGAALRCGQGAPVLALSQKRFLPLGSPGAAPQTWQIPVCVRYGATGGTSQQCTLLPAGSGEVPLEHAAACPAWLQANAGENGYYHVSYGNGLLPKLLEGNGARLSLAERVGLLGDALALVDGGELPAADALAMAREFAAAPETQVVSGSMDIAGSVRKEVPTDLRPNYARFIRETYGGRARQMGWTSKAGDSDEDRLLRPHLLRMVSRDGEDKALASEAHRLALRWLTNHSAVSADTMNAVLATAAQFGDAALFDKFLAAAKAEKDRRDRGRLLSALGAFRDPALARRALGLTLASEFDIRETVWILLGPLEYPELVGLPFEFVKQHFDELAARLPRDFGAELPRVASAFCSLERRDEVEAFFKDRIGSFTGGPRRLEQELESIAICAAVKEKQQPGMAGFLRRQ